NDFGPAQIIKTTRCNRLLIHEHSQNPGFHYQFNRHSKRTVKAPDQSDVVAEYFMCIECQKLKKKFPYFSTRRPPIVLVHDGRLMGDPENPNNAYHFCEPVKLDI